MPVTTTRARSLAWGSVIGIALGAAYVLSPLTVWFVIVMIGVFAWTGRGLTERERRYVWTVLAVAVGIRLIALSALFLGNNRYLLVSFFWDGDGVYLKSRAMTIWNLWMGIHVSPVDFSRGLDHGYGWSSYLYIIAYLQYLTGLAPFGVHLFNVVLSVAGAVIMYRLIRSAYGRAPALLGLVFLLFLPTLIAWSVSALKEALYVFLLVVGLRAAVTAIRAARIRERVMGIALLAGAIGANSTLRPGAALIMIAGVGLGLAGSVIVRRVLLILLIVVVVPLAAVRLWQRPGVQAPIMSYLRVAANQHLGSTRTDGHAYRLLDQRIYSDPSLVTTLTADEGVRFVVLAFVRFVVEPLPWRVMSRSEMVFLVQQVIWYILVVLACVGFVAGLRRDALVTCMLAGVSAVGGAAIALNSANIGTMVRFRDTIVPFVAWLGALGAASIASGIMSRGAVSRRRASEKGHPAATASEAASV